MATHTIGVAIIGGGIFAREEHLPAVLENQSLALKAVYSRSRKSAEETVELVPSSQATSVRIYSDDSGAGKTYEDLLRNDDVAAVIIALPIGIQPEFIKKALVAGKHVLAEKPLAPDVASAEELIQFYRETHKKNGATLSIAEQYRFMPQYLWPGQEARRLGPITSFVCKNFHYMAADNKYFNTSWRTDASFPFGFALDGGVHWAAAIRLALGDDKVQTVVGLSNTASKHLPEPDTLHGIFKTRSGAIGSYAYSSASSRQESETLVICDKGSVKVTGTRGVVTRADGYTEEQSFEGFRGVKAEVDAWAVALAINQPDPMASPEEALGDLEFLEAMLKSGKEGGVSKTLRLQ